MKELLTSNVLFGITLTLLAYNIAIGIKKRFDLIILNPLLVSILIVLAVILIGDINYDNFNEGGKYISYLLTPTTVCLAVPLYNNFNILRKDYKAILAGIITGIFTSAFTVLPLTLILKLDKVHYITLLPKSITSAVGMVLSEDFGGLVPVTVISIIVTGIFGVIICDYVFKIFKIQSPIAQGIALGASSHAMGTSKAFSCGEVQGAISSLSLAVSGIFTAIIFSFLVNLR